jgi:WhiB family redox-sensing transcriptional regulator
MTKPPGGIIPVRAETAWQLLSRALVDYTPPCANDPELWFDSTECETAIRHCRNCPAQLACANYALAARERDGVWGGQWPGRPIKENQT